MALDFGEHADVVFEHAPLTNVLCQVRFPLVLSLLTQAGATGFQTALREQYPILQPQHTTNVQITNETLAVSQQTPVWRFTDEGATWTVGLATDFVSLETETYSDIGEFLTRFARILHVLRRTVRPADSLRTGFRKVNFIEAPERQQTASLRGRVRPLR